jgi:hypothetical protein
MAQLISLVQHQSLLETFVPHANNSQENYASKRSEEIVSSQMEKRCQSKIYRLVENIGFQEAAHYQRQSDTQIKAL